MACGPIDGIPGTVNRPIGPIIFRPGISIGPIGPIGLLA
jgi:hypothetical protein